MSDESDKGLPTGETRAVFACVGFGLALAAVAAVVAELIYAVRGWWTHSYNLDVYLRIVLQAFLFLTAESCLSVPGIVFSAIGTKSSKRRRIAVAGLIIGIAATVLAFSDAIGLIVKFS